MSIKPTYLLIDHKLFEVVLWIACPFWSLGFIKGLVFDARDTMIILDGTNAVVASSILVLWKYSKFRPQYLINFYCSFWVAMFILYWKNMGGIDGPFSYSFFTLMIFFVGVLKNRMRIILVTTLILVNIILVFHGDTISFLTVEPDSSRIINPIALDYLLNAVLIAFLVTFLKENYDLARNKINDRNTKLDELHDQLIEKKERLIVQEDVIKKMQSNLEVLIRDRTQEHELKNRDLEGYAYHNAHMIRGPLTNILALTKMIEENEGSGKVNKGEIKKIQESALALDEVIKKVNNVLK